MSKNTVILLLPDVATDYCSGRNLLLEATLKTIEHAANRGYRLENDKAEVFVGDVAEAVRRAVVLALSSKLHEVGVISADESCGIFDSLVTNGLPEEEQAFPFTATIHGLR